MKHLSNAGNLSSAAMDTMGAESGDTSRMVADERKKLIAHLNKKAKAFMPFQASGDGNTNFLISSFPKLRVIMYVRLPSYCHWHRKPARCCY